MSPGDLVVCVNTGVIRNAGNVGLSALRKGDIYTVEDISKVRVHGDIGIMLIEVPVPRGFKWWHSSRFRPCGKTNIDCLTALARKTERALAGKE